MKLSILLARQKSLSENTQRAAFLSYWLSTAICCLMVLAVMLGLLFKSDLFSQVFVTHSLFILYPIIFLNLLAVVAILFTSIRPIVESAYAFIMLCALMSIIVAPNLQPLMIIAALIVLISAVASAYFNEEIRRMV